MENLKIMKDVEQLREEIINHRRHFHNNPELSGEEFETSNLLKNYCKELGLDVVDVSTTGFYAVLDTKKPGKTVGLRCDIDALPIQETESNLLQARACKSNNDGVMHACGHDGHMAIELAVIKVLTQNKDELQGKVIFVFEEGEETGSGIRPMVKALKPLNLDVLYGTHIAAFMEHGKICIDSGPRMAGASDVSFEVVGKGGHGSRPDLAINPVFAAANILVGIASAWANQIDVTKTVTLGLTQIHGGSAGNIIPDTCSIGGSIRFFDEEEGKRALDIIYDVARHTAAAHRCTIKEHDLTGTIPLINDDAYSKRARESVKDLNPELLEEGVVWFASETFAKYRDVAPLVFMFAGTSNKEFGSGADQHNEYFDIYEETLLDSAKATIKIISDVLTSN